MTSRDYSQLTRAQLEQRLDAAEDVVVMWSWCPARDTEGDREAATHELWLYWLGLGGLPEPKHNTHLNDGVIKALAARRAATRAATLARIENMMEPRMTTYAQGTNVSARRSRDEIERLLRRYGATDFALGEAQASGVVAFVMGGFHIKITVPFPTVEEFEHTPTGRRRTTTAAAEQQEQAMRARWRSLVLILKAKLEAIASGVVTFEQEFGMHMVLPDGQTVSEHVLPAIAQAYAEGEVPPLLGPLVTRPQLASG